jgi:hypothetical protein
VSVDPRFERFVLAEFALRKRRGRRADRSHRARVLAEMLHQGRDELLAIELVGNVCPPASSRPLLARVRALAAAPGLAGYLARVVARAGIEDRLDGARPTGDTLAALLLLPDPRLAR